MGERAIFQGTFSDFKVIKTRKVAQFVVEVPIEGADAALAALGGVPRADKEVWVVVARLDPKAAGARPSEPEKPKFSLARQAAMACDDPRFVAFLAEKEGVEIADPAQAVRAICEVQSRAEFDTDPEAGERWQALYTEFQAEEQFE